MVYSRFAAILLLATMAGTAPSAPAQAGAPAAAAGPPPSATPRPSLSASPAEPATPRFREIEANADTLRLLRSGGFVLYLRHAPTDNTKTDHVPVNLADCSRQRPATAAGLDVVRNVGKAIRQAGIPVGEVRTSPMCRAKDSALAAFGKGAVVDDLLMYVANFTASEKAPILENTRRLLGATVPAGTNRVLVAHAPNLMDIMGYFPKEATLVIFRPMGDGKFEYLASIAPDAWPRLLKP